MMKFSAFNPIRFAAPGALRSGHDGCVRMFAESDLVMIEVFRSSGEELPVLEVVDADNGETIGEMPFKDYPVNGDEHMGLLEAGGFSPGCYVFRAGGFESETVRVAADSETRGTVLVQYAYRDNRRRTDVLTKVFSGTRYFSLRLPGGFKDSGWTFGVESERFDTQSSDPVELAATDHTDKVLTIGTPRGVDRATAELANRLLTCPLVFIDGTRYARCEGASFDLVSDNGDGSAVYSVLLREAHYVNAEMEGAMRLNLRRTPDAIRRADEMMRRYR